VGHLRKEQADSSIVVAPNMVAIKAEKGAPLS